MSKLTVEERIQSYIVKSKKGCWAWFGANSNGHGIISCNGKTLSVKKWLYKSQYPDKHIDGYLIKTCINNFCVNPEHYMNRDDLFLLLISRDGNGGCWNWLGSLKGGYAVFSVSRKEKFVHRMIYEKYKGKIPEKMNVCHNCDNTKCVNPDHLWVGTQLENVQDMMRKKRGNKSYGENHHRSKITDKDALNIKLEQKNGLNMKEIHRKLGISYRIVQRVCNNQNWNHIKI